MILEIVKYGHPVLRKKGDRIESITAEIKKLITDMFETMEANHGVGLAAQQVGMAKQLTVIDVREITDRPSTLELNGQPVDPAEIMPLVLINPQVTPVGEPATGGRLPEFSRDLRGHHPPRRGGRPGVGRQRQTDCVPLRRPAGPRGPA